VNFEMLKLVVNFEILTVDRAARTLVWVQLYICVCICLLCVYADKHVQVCI